MRRPGALAADPTGIGAKESALDADARYELRRYRRAVLGQLLFGAVLVVASVVGMSMVESRADDLEVTGARVSGTVVNVVGHGEKGSVTVTFTWAGEERRTVIHTDGGSPRYEVGQAVVAIVDRDDPSHVTLPGETNSSPLTTTALLFSLVVGGLFGLCGLVGLARYGSRWNLLAASVWVRLPTRYAVTSHGKGVRLLIEVTSADGPHVLTMRSTPGWRFDGSGLQRAPELEVAGDPAVEVVLRIPGRRFMYGARPPRSEWSRRRWSKRIERTPQEGEFETTTVDQRR